MLRTVDGTAQSNRVSFNSFRADGVIWPDVVQPMLQGQRVQMNIRFETMFGPRSNVRLHARIEPPEMGSIGPAGIITAGYTPGTLRAVVQFGPLETDCAALDLEIGHLAVEPPAGTGALVQPSPTLCFVATMHPAARRRPPKSEPYQPVTSCRPFTRIPYSQMSSGSTTRALNPHTFGWPIVVARGSWGWTQRAIVSFSL